MGNDGQSSTCSLFPFWWLHSSYICTEAVTPQGRKGELLCFDFFHDADLGSPLQVLLIPVPCSLLLILSFDAAVPHAMRCSSALPSVCINPCLVLFLVDFSFGETEAGKLEEDVKECPLLLACNCPPEKPYFMPLPLLLGALSCLVNDDFLFL